MRRREFITLLGGAVSTWPLAAHAQQPALPVIGFLNGASEEAYAARIAVFLRGLAEAGFVAGTTVRIEFRHADGHYDRLPELANDLVRRRVAVIMTAGTAATLAAKAATTTIPIVFSSTIDPVALGFVASLAHPGGNLTGTARLNVEVGAKRLQLLHEMAPTATNIAMLVNPANSVLVEPLIRDAEAASRTLGLTLHVLRASTEREIDDAFSALVRLRAGALVIGADSFFSARYAQIIALAVRHRMPTIGNNREFVADGGLMSYGGNVDDGYRIAGTYAARILKGAKPADLSVQQSTRLELLINLKTARELGITVPPTLLAQADEVIE
jgi:putative tryptophan/tyrosine transport system substrate-binding protein